MASRSDKSKGAGGRSVFSLDVSVRVKPGGIGAGELTTGGRPTGDGRARRAGAARTLARTGSAAVAGAGRRKGMLSRGSAKRIARGSDVKDAESDPVGLVRRDGWRTGVVSLGTGEGSVSHQYGPFNAVVPPAAGQQAAYDMVDCDRLVDACLQGYDCTLFAYGQTGSGKTHTLFGPPGCTTEESLRHVDAGVCPVDWGLFPRATVCLLGRLGLIGGSVGGVIGGAGGAAADTAAEESSGTSASVIASVAEVYINQCYDLLNDKLIVPVAGMGRSVKAGAALRGCLTDGSRDKNGKWVAPWRDGKLGGASATGYEASGQKEWNIRSAGDVARLSRLVEATRSAKSHALNARSSRSHCVVKLQVQQRSGKTLTTSNFLFVDLAGSERLQKSGSTGMRSVEARNINTSLSALGRVVQALGRGKGAFVPYRDSTLTMLLKQSLGGSCRTALVVTVSEDPTQADETQCSLQFGMSCRRVKNRATVSTRDVRSEVDTVRAALARSEAALRQLEAQGAAGGINMDFPPSSRASWADNRKRLAEHMKRSRAAKFRLVELRAQDAPAAKIEVVEKTFRYEESQVNNLRGILVRMIFSGLWIESKPSYDHRLGEVRDLRQRLARLTGEPVSEEAEADNVHLTVKNLLTDFPRGE